MRIVKASAKPSTSKKFSKVKADEDINIDEQIVDEAPVDEAPAEGGEATVAPEATDMLFEAEDVAELVAEVTGEEVTVEVDDADDSVIFTVGEEEFTIEPEGDEEILEASSKQLRGKADVRATKKAPVAKKAVRASRKASAKKALRRR